jgi:hypothetical protein
MTATAIDSTRRVLDMDVFAAMVGVQPRELPAVCREALSGADLGYEVLTGAAREAQLLRALRGGEASNLAVSGPHRADDWERGWNQNLREFAAAAGDPAMLVPKYNHHLVLRLRGDYVRVAEPHFEYSVYTALRHFLFATWFADLDRVVEYGCGTGTSLMLLAKQLPHLSLCGLDWAPSSQQIVARLGATLGRSIDAARFDMFAPTRIELGPRCGVFTSAALEQIGERHDALLEHWLQSAPAIGVHLEPIVELYDETVLFDDVARRYHTRRNYLRGFLPKLRELAAAGRIEILAEQRTGLGSFFHEGYSVVVWRPVVRREGGA